MEKEAWTTIVWESCLYEVCMYNMYVWPAVQGTTQSGPAPWLVLVQGNEVEDHLVLSDSGMCFLLPLPVTMSDDRQGRQGIKSINHELVLEWLVLISGGWPLGDRLDDICSISFVSVQYAVR